MRIKLILTVFLPLICFSVVLARVYDEAKNHNYIYAKSTDSSIDYRNAPYFLYDTARFKRDMRDNRNRNPGANQFWLVYKSVAGFNCLHTRVFYLAGVSDETHFYIGRDQTEKREITPSYTGTFNILFYQNSLRFQIRIKAIGLPITFFAMTLMRK